MLLLLRNMRACLSSLIELDAAQMEERAFQGRQASRGLVSRPPNRETAAGQGRAKKFEHGVCKIPVQLHDFSFR